MIKKRSGSVLYQYVMSHCGITLLFCALIGVWLCVYFFSQYGQVVQRNETAKGEVLLEDLETQYSLMSEISFALTQDIAYTYQELQQNNYLEKELLTCMERYTGSSVFSKNFFLMFQGKKKLYSSVSFSSGGTAYDYSLFMNYYLKCSDPDSLFETLSAIKQQSILRVPGYPITLFVFPLRIRSASVNAVLCFFISESEMANRACLVTGTLKYAEVYSEDNELYTLDQIQDKTAKHTTVIPLVSRTGRFRMDLYVNSDWYLPELISYQKLILLAVTTIILVLGITIFVSIRHYRPIESINSMVVQGDTKNELDNIRTQVSRILEEASENEKILSQQMSVLREQTLHLLFNGAYLGESRSLLSQMGIRTEDAESGIILLQMSEITNELLDDISELSDDETRFFACLDKEAGRIAILVNRTIKKESAINIGPRDALDLIANLLETRRSVYSAGVGCFYSDLQNLTASYAEAQDDLIGKSMTSLPLTNDESRIYFKKITTLTRIGDSSGAIELLTEYAKKSELQCPSLMWQRCMYVDLMHMLVGLAHENNIEIASSRISVVLTAQGTAALYNGLRNLVLFICDEIGGKQITENDHAIVDNILLYIRDHFTENDLSLEKLGDTYHMSPVYLSTLVKNATGIGYKDYVVHLRIERAKECLLAGHTTTETCQLCGYVNVSHFIRSFKASEGVTPAVFQKNNGHVLSNEEES